MHHPFLGHRVYKTFNLTERILKQMCHTCHIKVLQRVELTCGVFPQTFSANANFFRPVYQHGFFFPSILNSRVGLTLKWNILPVILRDMYHTFEGFDCLN